MGVVCYQIIGGGSSRRRLYAQTNRIWTQGLEVKHGSGVYKEERWYLEKSHCNTTDVRDCFFIINAYNGRRLYKTGPPKLDFGGTPQVEVNTADFCKWYMKDMGTSTSISYIKYSIASPAASPTASPTSLKPPSPEAQLFNFEANAWLWASKDTSGGYYGNRGARLDENPIEDTVWKFDLVECPIPMSNFNLPMGVVCYQIIGGGSSRRRLYAQTNRIWTQGLEVKHGSGVYKEERWYLEKSHCNTTDVRDCFFIINAYNGRRLYKTGPPKLDFGGTPQVEVNTADFCKWYMKDMGTSTPISYIEYTYTTEAPSETPSSSSSQEPSHHPSLAPTSLPSVSPTSPPTTSLPTTPPPTTSPPTTSPPTTSPPTTSPPTTAKPTLPPTTEDFDICTLGTVMTCGTFGCVWKKSKCTMCSTLSKKKIKTCTKAGCNWVNTSQEKCQSCNKGSKKVECNEMSCVWKNVKATGKICTPCAAIENAKKKKCQKAGCAFSKKKCASCLIMLKENKCNKQKGCAWSGGQCSMDLS